MVSDEAKCAQQILDAINYISYNSTTVAKCLASGHPTLQQDFMRIVLAYIKEMATKNNYDLRNAGSVNIAQKIVERLEETDFFLARV